MKTRLAARSPPETEVFETCLVTNLVLGSPLMLKKGLTAQAPTWKNVPYCRAVDLKLEGTWPKPRTKLTLKILSGKKADYGSYMLSEGERAGLKRPGFR